MTKINSLRSSVTLSRVATIASAFMALLFAASTAHALDPNRILTQYGHSTWRIQDGVVAGAVTSLAQTKDGYLWVGTRAGLLRFNGLEMAPFKPPSGEPVRSPRIESLLGARDGSLWIGTSADLERWDSGRLTHYPGDVGYILGWVLDIRETHDGQVWIARSRVPAGEGPVCRVGDAKLICVGAKEGIALTNVMDILEDKSGNLLLHSDQQLIRWNPRVLSAEVLQTIKPGADGIQALAYDRDGVLLIGSAVSSGSYGLSSLQGSRLQPLVYPLFDGRAIAVQTLFLDSNKDLWIGTQSQGLYRISGQRVEHYRSIDGLSSDSINKIFEDREGNVWVATQQGVDRFRDVKVASYSAREGLSTDQVNAVVASRDGSIWISNYHALDVLHGTTVTSFLGGRELPGAEVTSMFEDRMGRMWVGIDKTLTLFDKGIFRAVRRQDGGETGGISALTDDPAGNLWVISQAGAHGSLLRIEGQTIMQEITFDQLAIAKAGAMASDRESGIWVPMFNGNVAHWHDGHADIIDLHRASHTGNITGIIGAPDGSIYVSSALGVVGIRGSKWQTLNASNGLPCTAVRTILWDAEQLWLYADCGLLSVSSAEVDEWWHDPKAVLKVRAFDSFDGVQPAAASRYPKSSKSPDGRLWFANSSVLQVMDPSNVRTNQTVPLVQIEKVVADGTPLPVAAAFHLRPLTRNLEFDYSSSSFAIPQKVKYRYQLEGYDKNWQEVGNRHQAFYTGLPPGRFRFRVIASNNDGLWNMAGASLSFEVMPAFFQTGWFIVFCSFIIAAAIWLLYLARIRQVTARIRLQVEARLKEREQIARDLHDTLLQGVQGLMYQFQAATERLSNKEPIRAVLEESLNRADDLIAQGRERVSGLRGTTPLISALEDALNSVALDLAKVGSKSFHSSIQGVTRPLHPITREELFRIGSEALINAFRHAMASRIEMEIVYDSAYVLLRVRDNGSGFDVDSLSAGGRAGHFGLLGMQERARRLNTRANIWSRPGAGTEISVRVASERADLQPVLSGFWGWIKSRIRAAKSTQ